MKTETSLTFLKQTTNKIQPNILHLTETKYLAILGLFHFS